MYVVTNKKADIVNVMMYPNSAQSLQSRLSVSLEEEAERLSEMQVRDYHRPMNELAATPIDITQLLIALAHLAYFNREYSAGRRTAKNLTMPDCWTSPTAERMARWLLKFPSNLSLVKEIAEAVILDYPVEAHTDYERLAHRAGDFWLRNFRDGYTLSHDGAAGYWTPDMWLKHAVPALSGLVVAYLSVKSKTQRQHLYDFMSAWQLCPKATESLFETTNLMPEVLDAADQAAPYIIDADKRAAAGTKPFRDHDVVDHDGNKKSVVNSLHQATLSFIEQVSYTYRMAEEFMDVAYVSIKNSNVLQRGRVKYSVGVFNLVHALELTYKLLLLKEGITVLPGGGMEKYPYTHDLKELFAKMAKLDRTAISKVMKDAGWKSHCEFHGFVGGSLRFLDRKYYDFNSSTDHYTHDLRKREDHRFYPEIFRLCDSVLQYAASTIWKDTSFSSDL